MPHAPTASDLSRRSGSPRQGQTLYERDLASSSGLRRLSVAESVRHRAVATGVSSVLLVTRQAVSARLANELSGCARRRRFWRRLGLIAGVVGAAPRPSAAVTGAEASADPLELCRHGQT